MAGVTERPASRHWTDVLAIVTGVALIAVSLWPTTLVMAPDTVNEAGNAGLLVLVRVAAGVLAIGAVILAQTWRRRPLARGLLVAAAVVLVAGLVLVGDFGGWALGTMLLPAVLLLVAAVAVGPLPDTP